MADNPFDQFDGAAPPPAATMGAPPPKAFDQFDTPQAGIMQNALHPVANGMFPFGLADKMRAAAAATKESLSGGLPFGEAYSQALPQYQAATQQQEQDHPVATAAGKAAGSLPTLILGGGAANAGLRALGPVGQFLAGETAAPAVARAANGTFRALTGSEKVAATVAPALSRTALMAREGAQAGAYGAANDPNGDVLQGAGYGALLGGAAGAIVPPVVAGLGRIAQIPASAAGYLPHWAQGALGVVGGEKILEHAPQLASAMAEHPIAGTAAVAGAGLLGTSAFLAAHPALRDLVTRLGIMGYAAGLPGAAAPR